MAGKGHEARGFLLVIAVIALLAISILAGNVFIVREIEVQGNSALSDADVIRFSGLGIGGSIFRVDVDSAMRALTLSGRIKPVSIETRLPDTIVLTVSEREPSAYVDCYGVILIVDEEGALLERVTALPADTLVYVTGLKPTRYDVGRILVTGVNGQVEAMAAALRALREASAVSLVSELNVANPDNMYLITRGGMRVLLGDESALGDKLSLAIAAMNDLQGRGITQGRLDVRTGKHADFRE